MWIFQKVDKYIADKNGDYITKVGVPIAEVEAIDLEEFNRKCAQLGNTRQNMSKKNKLF